MFEPIHQGVTDAEVRSTRQARVIGFFSFPDIDEVYQLLQMVD